MEHAPATPGQIKQICAKVLSAIPADAFSFVEAERLLRDGKLAQDIAVLLRRHYNNEPLEVNVPDDACTALYDLGCNFAYWDSVRDEPNSCFDFAARDSGVAHMLATLIKSHSLTRSSGSTSRVEVMSLETEKTLSETLGQIRSLGYRSADACEAAGFLQARGRSFRNAGKQSVPHFFQVIADTGLSTLEFCTYHQPGRDRIWTITGFEDQGETLSLSSEILVVKL